MDLQKEAALLLQEHGLLEILLVRAPRNLTEIAECIQAFQSQNYNNCAMVTFRSARKVRILSNPGMLWTLDGEREEGHWEVMAENVHHAIHLIKKADSHD